MLSASFRMNAKYYVDKAQSTHFDLQNSPYHTWPHLITANHSLKYFPVSD